MIVLGLYGSHRIYIHARALLWTTYHLEIIETHLKSLNFLGTCQHLQIPYTHYQNCARVKKYCLLYDDIKRFISDL